MQKKIHFDHVTEENIKKGTQTKQATNSWSPIDNVNN